MNSTHTPGPWLVCEDERNVYQPDLDVSITNHDAYLGVLDDAEALANARLIAAAPDLLEACESVLRYLDSLRHYGLPGRKEQYDRLYEACSKARGKKAWVTPSV